MKKKFALILAGVLIVVGIIAATYIFQFQKSNDISPKSSEVGFLYEEANSQLKKNLKLNYFSMSSAIKLSTNSDIQKFCTFFSDPDNQKLVEYCTSTEILDSKSNFIGNIHIVGTVEQPKLILTILQSDSEMSQIDDMSTIFETVIESLVCKCWEDIKPGNFVTVQNWIDAHKNFHLSENKTNSKSSPIIIAEKQLQMEVTTNDDGYLWKLLVYT